MPFWSADYNGLTTGGDPKRNFRFIVQINGISPTLGGVTPTIIWYAKEVTKPSFTVNIAEHSYLNHKFKFPGTVTWNDIDLTVVDPQDDADAAAVLSDLWERSGYQVPASAGTGANLATVSKGRAVTAMGQVTVTQVDSQGAPIETWTLKNAFCKGITYGDAIAYGNDQLTTYKLSIVYDFASMIALDPGKTYFD